MSSSGATSSLGEFFKYLGGDDNGDDDDNSDDGNGGVDGDGGHYFCKHDDSDAAW